MRVLTAILCAMAVLLCPFSVGAVSVSSASAVLYEPQSGRVLYEKDADTRRPMASTTKLMTALVATEHLEADTVITVPETAVLVEGSAMGLRGGDVLTVRDLLAGLLLSSGNDAANVLALSVCESLPSFATRMNAKAAALGLSRSTFVTPSGLDAKDHASTARDMAMLGAAVLREPLLSELCASKYASITINGTTSTISNHNRLLWLYDDAIGMKTGFTKKSGKCLVSAARRDGVTLIVASMNGGDYWNDHMSLYDYGFSRTVSAEIALPSLPSLAVCGGESETVSLSGERPETVVLLREEQEQITCEWELPRFVWAPVRCGETLGMLRYRVGERVLAEVPLTAKTSVAERAPIPVVKKWCRQWRRLLGAVVE